MLRHELRLAAAALALGLAACGDLSHQNAFDPNTPPALRAKATLAGAVTLEALDASEPDLSGVLVSVPGTSLTASTDAAGHFTLTGVEPGSWTVQATKAGYKSATVTGVTVTLDDGNSTVAVPTLDLLVARGDILGRVALQLDALSGEKEASAAGVGVSLSGRPGAAFTDVAGNFLFSGVPVGTYVITASKYGFKTDSIQLVEVTEGRITVLAELVLPPDPGGVEGAVLVLGASDSAGVTVRARGTSLSGTPTEVVTLSDAAGAWRISPLPAGSYNVTFEKTDYAVASTSVVVAPAEVTALAAVTLQRDTGSLVGTARLQGAGDHAGIQVTLTPEPTAGDPTPAAAAAAITDSAGSWRADLLAVGRYTVAYRKQPGYLDQSAAAVVVSHQVARAPDATLPAVPGAIQGKALLEGAPAGGLAGTLVRIEGSTLSTVTLADGGYVLSGVGAGAAVLVLERPGHDTQRVQVVVGPGETIALFDVTLPVSRGAITGRFTLAGAPSSAGVVVTANGAGSATTVTDASGQFSMTGLPVGTYALTAGLGADWQPVTVTGVAVAPGATTALPGSPVALSPVATASIAGTVLAEGGAAIGTTVTLSGQDFRGTPVGATATSGAAGGWSFGGLAAGSYQVTFTRDGWESPAPLGVALSAGQGFATGATTLARSRGTVAGTITLTGAGSSAGVVVTLAGTAFSTVTDAAGAYTLSAVPVGSYTLLAAKPPEWVSASVPAVAVTRDATTTVPVTSLVPAGTGSIAGKALVEGGAALGTTVTLSGQDFRNLVVNSSTTTSAAGDWTFANLPAGSYQVTFSRTNWETPAPLGVALGTGQAYAAGTTTLALSRGAIGGVFALASAASSAGVVVTLSGTSFATVTDATGAFTLAGVPVGSYTVVAARPPDWTGASVAGVAVTRNGTTTVTGSPITLQPVKTSSISGTMLAEGAAATGTLVSLTGQDFRGQAVTSTFTTAAAGTWTFGTLAAGSYQVTFSRAGYEAPAPLAISLGSGQAYAAGSATLALSRGAIAGAFTLTGAGSSAGVVVTLSGTAFSTVTDAAGAFTLSGVPVGSYTVVAAKPPDWQGASVAAVAVTRNATTTITGSPVAIAPVAGSSLTGTTLAEGLADASGTTVSLSGVDFRGAAVTRSGTTAASGAWSFGGLVAGSYQVTFSRASFDTPAPAGVSVVTGQAASLGTLTLPASRGTAAGTVVATGAPSRAGTVVTVSGGPDTASTVTDANGAWRIDGLRVGTGYQATYTRPAYVSQASAAFTVASSTTTPVTAATLALDATGRIAGVARLERPAAGPFNGTTVTLAGFDVNGAAVAGSTSTAADGSFQLTGLPEGTYGLSFAKVRYDTQALGGLFVAAGTQVTAAGVVLQVSRAVVAGTVSLDAGAVAGFQVGTDFSGVVVTLSGTDVPIPSVVTDAAGTYRFVDVPVSLAGATFTVSAGKPFFGGGSASVLAVANATTTVLPIALSLSDGSLTGTVLLSDNFKGGGDNADHTGTLVDVSGTAFNGVGWQAVAITGADGFWDSGPLPPGTYDLTPASAGRTCELYKRTAVEPRLVNDQGGIRCFDALAPGSLALGDPTPSAGADTGYTSAASVEVPIVTQATDPTLPDANLRGYEVTVGAAPDWAKATLVEGQPATLTFTGLVPNARNLLWARAVDFLGNAGTATSAEVVTDSTPPRAPAANTPRVIVSDVSTSVTLTGSESDANFSTYEACSVSVGPTASCAASAPAGCTFASTDSNVSLALATSQKTCFYARAKDHAGNRSGQATLSVVSDLIPPDAPTVAPLYDPTIFTVQADYVDFFVTAAATDQPAGQGAWGNVAWVEVDTGAGFEPLCPQATCRPGGVYAPCAAACTCGDARRLCRGTEFAGVRMPLLGGTANRFSIRAVDVAGNVGSGATQLVNTGSSSALVATSTYDEARPRTRGGLLTFTGGPVSGAGAFTGRLVALGTDKRFDPTDVTCDLESPWFGALYPSQEPITPTAVVFAGGLGQTLKVRRAGADAAFCTADDQTTTLRDVGASPQAVIAAAASLDAGGTRERAAWAEGNTSVRSISVVVRESGANRLLDLAGDDTNVVVAGPFADLVTEIALGGNVLLYRRQTGGYTAITATTGLFTGARTTWPLPAGAIAAAIDTAGQLMAWVANDPAQTIHLLTPGFDGVFGTGDDVERTRTISAPQLFSAGVAVEAGHIVVAETSLASGPAYVSHWYDGGDGNFGTGDDQVTRILPSSRGRLSPALAGGVAAGTVYLQLGQANTGENADLVAVDLSARRWEVASDAALSGPRPNNAGTLFYQDGSGTVLWRSSDGRELRGPASVAYAASGSQLFYGSGSSLFLQGPDASGQWFAPTGPAATAIVTTLGTITRVEAADGLAIVEATAPVTGALHLVRNAAGTWTSTRLDNTVAAATEPYPASGMGVSSRHAVWGCRPPATFQQYACFRSAGPDGTLGTADDVSGRINTPGTASPYFPIDGLRVSGNKAMVVVFRAGATHLVVTDAGTDGTFNTADDSETDLGAVGAGGATFYDFRGGMLAWAQVVAGLPGTQVFVHDLRDGTRRQLTTHYSQKAEVRVEASGRVFWTDTLLQAQAIFLSSP